MSLVQIIGILLIVVGLFVESLVWKMEKADFRDGTLIGLELGIIIYGGLYLALWPLMNG